MILDLIGIHYINYKAIISIEAVQSYPVLNALKKCSFIAVFPRANLLDPIQDGGNKEILNLQIGHPYEYPVNDKIFDVLFTCNNGIAGLIICRI